MVKRVLAWSAVLAGGLVTVESVFIAHKPNWVWILILLIGIAYFAKNGFLRQKPSAPTAAS
ncbi:MAG: hypothetical protein ACYC7A_06180 [Thermoanaerobaculia bacterium]